MKRCVAFRSRGQSRGFTLVELMVAITGGLFIAIIVFIISRNSARFYQTEARIGEATLGSVVGFERLRTDLARAGFLASPNIAVDPKVCAGPATPGVLFPNQLKELASVRIIQNAPPSITTLLNNNITPDRIILAGSYVSVDQFPMTTITTDSGGGGWRVALQPEAGPMVRIGYGAAPDKPAKMAVLAAVFGTGRALRIVDHGGMQYYGAILGVDVTDPNFTPEIVLADQPVVEVEGTGICSLRNGCVGCQVNVVNFIQYDVRNLKDSPNAPSPNPYGPLYDDAGAAPFDGDRSELARVELDVNGDPIPGTEELVTEYAVDLRFGLTVDNRATLVPTLTTLLPDDTTIPAWAGGIGGGGGARPQRIRGIRVRMSVRSAEADREADIDQNLPTIAPGLYRIRLGAAGTAAPFARVRTLQSDVALHNTMGVPW